MPQITVRNLPQLQLLALQWHFVFAAAAASAACSTVALFAVIH